MNRTALLMLAALFVAVSAAGCSELPSGGSGSASTGHGVVQHVVDGDTIVLRGGARVRLLQVDAPEVHAGPECGGREASAAARRLLPAGTKVRLERDPVSDDRDRYGRLLRYVWVGDTVVNLELVRDGLAMPYFYRGGRGRYAAQLERLARRARSRSAGLWGQCPDAVLDPDRGASSGPLVRLR